MKKILLLSLAITSFACQKTQIVDNSLENGFDNGLRFEIKEGYLEFATFEDFTLSVKDFHQYKSRYDKALVGFHSLFNKINLIGKKFKESGYQDDSLGNYFKIFRENSNVFLQLDFPFASYSPFLNENGMVVIGGIPIKYAKNLVYSTDKLSYDDFALKIDENNFSDEILISEAKSNLEKINQIIQLEETNSRDVLEYCQSSSGGYGLTTYLLGTSYCVSGGEETRTVVEVWIQKTYYGYPLYPSYGSATLVTGNGSVILNPSGLLVTGYSGTNETTSTTGLYGTYIFNLIDSTGGATCPYEPGYTLLTSGNITGSGNFPNGIGTLQCSIPSGDYGPF